MNKRIGIIGGIGPYAGLDFMRNIFNNTKAVRDQEHTGAVLVSCPALIPDRTRFLLGEAPENPAPGMFECARMLSNAGADIISVACNTAHSERIFSPFSAMVRAALPHITIINMLETCGIYVRNQLPAVKKIGLLATRGTYQSRVYAEYFRAEDGFVLIEPDEGGQTRIHQAIYSEDFGIKAHSNPVHNKAKRVLLDEISRLTGRGAAAIILGCTELPLAVSPNDISCPALDPGLLTARRLVSLAAPEKLLP